MYIATSTFKPGTGPVQTCICTIVPSCQEQLPPEIIHIPECFPIPPGFTVDGGCSRIYEAMASYLGDAIKLNVEPFTIRRPYGVSASNPMRVTYTQGNATVRTTCRRLIVSGVQTMQNLRSFLTDVDNKERGVFEQVRE